MPDGSQIWQPNRKGAALLMPRATNNAAQDYQNWLNVRNAAGVGGIIEFPTGQTYLALAPWTRLNGQTIRASESTLKVPDQVVATVTSVAVFDSAGVSRGGTFDTTVVTGVGSANLVAVLGVSSSTGLIPNQNVVLDDQTVAGTITTTISGGGWTVTSVGSGTVTLACNNAQAEAIVRNFNTSTNAEPTSTSYTPTPGANLKLVTVPGASGVIQLPYGTTLGGVMDLMVNGNAANNTLGQRWEVAQCINFRADHAYLHNIHVQSAMTDALYNGAHSSRITHFYADQPRSFGIHNGASNGSPADGAMATVVDGFFINSPGMASTMKAGHAGGLSQTYPAYPAVGFSNNVDHCIFKNGEVTNTSSAPLCQGIGDVGNASVKKLEFGSIYIDNMVKGGFQITGGTGDQPTDIDMHDVHVTNCAPTDYTIAYGAAQQSLCSVIGSYSGTTVIVKVRMTNCDFTDSPLVIQGAQDVKMSNTWHIATTVGASATLSIIGGTANTDTVVNMDNVNCFRPLGNSGTAPVSSQFSCNTYFDNATIIGRGLYSRGGRLQNRWQNTAIVRLTGAKSEDAYNFGFSAYSTGTIVDLQNPEVILNSGFTASSSWSGFQGGNGANGGTMTVRDANFKAVFTNIGQAAVTLSANTAAGTGTKIHGGTFKATGTVPTSFFISGGPTTPINSVCNVVTSYALSLGTAELARSFNNNVVADL